MGQSKEEMEVCYSILFLCLVAVHVEKQMDRREVDDPCYYLLAIWSPGKISGFQFLVSHLSVVRVRRLAFLTCHLASRVTTLFGFIWRKHESSMFDGWWCVDEAPESMPKMGDDIQHNPFAALSGGFGGESETVKGTLLVSQY